MDSYYTSKANFTKLYTKLKKTNSSLRQKFKKGNIIILYNLNE